MFALGVRLPAFRAPAELSYDDGVYQAAAISMRTGALPFRQVFSAQGPLFYPAVWFADLLGFRTDHAPRIAAVAAGIAITICAVACGSKVRRRILGGRHTRCDLRNDLENHKRTDLRWNCVRLGADGTVPRRLDEFFDAELGTHASPTLTLRSDRC